MPVFASIHVGKCAGAAFANLLIREVSPQMPVLLFYGQGHPATGLWNNRVREPIKADGNSLKEICGPLLEGVGGSCLVQGHITAREYLEFLPEERELFTWLRHPLQRICSHYYYWKNNRRCDPAKSRIKTSANRVAAAKRGRFSKPIDSAATHRRQLTSQFYRARNARLAPVKRPNIEINFFLATSRTQPLFTSAALVDEVIAAKRKACGRKQRPASHDYIVDLNVRLGRFKEQFGNRMIATFTRLEIDDWLTGLTNKHGENLSPQSRGNYARAWCGLLLRGQARICP